MPTALTDDPEVAARKRALRARLRAARRTHAADPAARDAQAQALAEALLAHPAAATGCVAVFEPLPTEPPLQATTSALLDRGVRVLVPHLLPDLDLDWRRLGAPEDPGPRLGPDAIGAAGLVLVPALAVDAAGGRLGQGGGSYDRALLRRRPDAVLVGVVHDDEFRTESVPTQPHDVRLHAVLTARRGWTNLPTSPDVCENRPS